MWASWAGDFMVACCILVSMDCSVPMFQGGDFEMSTATSQMPVLLGQSAFELFAEQGFNRVNLDQIAARAGVTKGSLYWHYKNKKELILAACNHYYQQWFEHVHSELASCLDPEVRIRKVVEYSVYSCVIEPKNRIFTTGVFTLMQEDAEIRASWTQFYNSVREFYVGLVMAAVAHGQFQTEDPRRAVNLMLEAIEGIKVRACFEPQISDACQQKQLVEDLIGILSR